MARDRTLGLRLKAVDKISSVIDRVSNKFPRLTRGIQRASLATKIFNAQTKRMRAGLLKVGGAMKRVGSNLTRFVTLPLVAGAAAGVKFFIDFEQGLKGVEKTTGLAGKQLQGFGDQLDLISVKLPVGTQELLELAQAGGQLGVKGRANLEKFTITLAKLGRASNVVGEEGAKSIVRILTVTQEGIGVVDKFSSALVQLGNNFAASEREILRATNEISRGIAQFGGVTSKETLAIGTAISALGINAEAGGTVVTNAFIQIDKSIRGGGDRLKVLQKITGLTGKQLKKEFQTNAIGVFRKFVEGIGKVQKGGGDTNKVLGFLGLTGARTAKVIPVLAKRFDVLEDAMKQSTKAFKENTALNKEFAIQTQTLGSELIVLKNTFISFLRVIGAQLAPAVRFLSEVFRGIFSFLKNNPTIAILVVVFGALFAVMGPILIALGTFLVILPAITAGALALDIALLPMILSFLAIGGAIALVITAIILLANKWEDIKGFLGLGIDFIVAKFRKLPGVILAVAKAIPVIGPLIEVLSSIGIGAKVGPPIGAKEKNIRAAGGGRDTFSGVLDVNFRNAPQGTTAKAASEGPIDLNLGFAGGIL